MNTVIRRLLALCACVLVLASCQVDVAVDMTMDADGTGAIRVVITADADVIRAVPTLADDLVLDDVVAAGWVAEGPSPTPDGGLTISISHDFVSAQDATNLLNSIGPPFNQMAVTRTTVNNTTTNTLSGLLGLSNGFEAFADPDLITAVGSLPFGDEIEAAGSTPETSMSVTIRVRLPGDIVTEETNGTILDDGVLEWTVPMDGSIADWRGQSEQAPANNAWWARPLSVVSLIALIGWVVFMVLFIGYVAWARSRLARRYRDRPRPAPPA